MKKKRRIWLIILGILAVAIAVICIVKATKSANKELVIRTHVVGKYTVENTVTATGTIEPVETVEVGTQVSGKVEKIYVDFNDVVKKGQLMAELDKQTLNQSLSRAKASLTSSQSQLNYAKLSYERTKQLYEANAATLAAYQEAQNTYTQAQMSMKNAQASYDQARVDLAYAEIYSPIDGIVLDRAVEVGQTVAASFSTPTLFTLANDLTKMQVEADVDEADSGGTTGHCGHAVAPRDLRVRPFRAGCSTRARHDRRHQVGFGGWHPAEAAVPPVNAFNCRKKGKLQPNESEKQLVLRDRMRGGDDEGGRGICRDRLA